MRMTDAQLIIAKAVNITATSARLFIDLAKDAGNWSGTPLLDGNVRTDAHLRGNLTQLKKVNLVTTFNDDGTWVSFTADGKATARLVDIDLS